MSWNKNCVHAPKKVAAKHCNKTNSGKRYTGSPRRKESGIIGKGYYGCPAKCRFFEVKSKESTRYVMNEALV